MLKKHKSKNKKPLKMLKSKKMKEIKNDAYGQIASLVGLIISFIHLAGCTIINAIINWKLANINEDSMNINKTLKELLLKENSIKYFSFVMLVLTAIIYGLLSKKTKNACENKTPKQKSFLNMLSKYSNNISLVSLIFVILSFGATILC